MRRRRTFRRYSSLQSSCVCGDPKCVELFHLVVVDDLNQAADRG